MSLWVKDKIFINKLYNNQVSVINLDGLIIELIRIIKIHHDAHTTQKAKILLNKYINIRFGGYEKNETNIFKQFN